MGDITSELPVRTVTNGDVVVRLSDGTTTSQLLAVDAVGRITVKLQDGSGNALSSTTGALNVNISASGITLNVQDAADGSVGAGVAASKSSLVGGIFNTSLPTLTNGQQAAVQVDSSGRLIVVIQGTATVSGAVTANIGTTNGLALDSSINGLTVAQSSSTAGEKGVLVQGAVTTAAPTYTTAQTSPLSLTTGGAVRVDASATTQPVSGTVNSALQVSGSAVTTANPVPVQVMNTLPGAQINKYNTTAAVAPTSVANHIYTITASKIFTGKKFWASASGRIRADVQSSPDGSTYSTFWTGFNSAATPNISVDLDLLSIQDSGTGATIRIQITNDDSAAFDVFSTVSGTEI